MKVQITYQGLKLIGFDINSVITERTQRKALQAAKANGLTQASVKLARNNLFKFWTVGQQQGDLYRIWKYDGSWVDVPCETVEGMPL